MAETTVPHCASTESETIASGNYEKPAENDTETRDTSNVESTSQVRMVILRSSEAPRDIPVRIDVRLETHRTQIRETNKAIRQQM